MDLKDAEAKVIQNYHLICLQMLGNIYQTNSGKDYIQMNDPSSTLINFCTYSLNSINPKVVFTAAVVLFNHVLCYKREKDLLYKDLENAMVEIIKVIADENLVDPTACLGLLLCECRILYLNKKMCEFITEKKEDSFKKNHQKLELRVKN
jgi:hypothetical protein